MRISVHTDATGDGEHHGLLLALGTPSRGPPGGVIPHPPRIANQCHVVDGNTEFSSELVGGTRAVYPASGPLAVVRDEHHRGRDHRGLRLDVHFNAAALAGPSAQIREVVSGRGPVRTRSGVAAKTIEQAHR